MSSDERQIPALRVDLEWVSHAGMKKGTSAADCQCRHCRKWRRELFEQGKITVQQAGLPDVKDEPLGERR